MFTRRILHLQKLFPSCVHAYNKTVSDRVLNDRMKRADEHALMAHEHRVDRY